MSNEKTSVLVPIDWLMELANLAEKAQDDLGLGEKPTTSPNYEISQIRLKIAPLIGYAKSAKYLTKHN